jgi:hypothetical protein
MSVPRRHELTLPRRNACDAPAPRKASEDFSPAQNPFPIRPV